jgi:pimeloyl-ACP methyl ester carboxylesterase
MLVILPGWMHDAAQWNVVSKLLNNMNVKHVVLDFPGFGTVPKDTSITSFDNLVTWSKNEIERLTAGTDEPVTLLGHSCGGRITLALAVDNINYKQLILIGSPNLYRPTLKVKITKVLARVVSPIQFLIPAGLRNKFRSADYAQATKTGMQELYHSVVVHDQTALTGQVTTKVHLLWGALDTAAPVRIAYELEELLPHTSLTVLPNLGHNLHHENPGLLAGKIKLFLRHD